MVAGLALAQSGSYLGIGVMRVNPARVQELKLPDAAGVEVTAIAPGGPAENAGLKVGDVITQYNGQRVRDNEQFVLLVRATPAGRQVKLQVYRGGAAQDMTARIGFATQSAGGVPGATAPRIPDEPQDFPGWRSPVLGVFAEGLQGQMAEFFGMSGVLVREVASGSAAEKAGIKAGDVIIGVGSMRVAMPEDITRRLQMMTGNSVPVTLQRKGQSITLNVTFEMK